MSASPETTTADRVATAGLVVAYLAVLGGLFWLHTLTKDGGGPLADQPPLAIVTFVIFVIASLPLMLWIVIMLPSGRRDSRPPRLHSAMYADNARKHLAAGQWDKATGAIVAATGGDWEFARREVDECKRKAGVTA